MSSIYKVLTEEEWEHAISLGYVVTKLDNDDGFIHLSTSKQLALTLHLYFKNSESYFVEIDQDSIKDEIVFEEAKSGSRLGKFPHLYGKLPYKMLKDWTLRNSFDLPKGFRGIRRTINMTDLTINQVYAIGAPIVLL